MLKQEKSTETKKAKKESRDFFELMETHKMDYFSDDDTMLSEEGIKTLNAYALKGYYLLNEYPLVDKPTTREEFLDAFYVAIKFYGEK